MGWGGEGGEECQNARRSEEGGEWVPETGTGKDGKRRDLGPGKGRRGTGRGADEKKQGKKRDGQRRGPGEKQQADVAGDGGGRGRGGGEGETRPQGAEVGQREEGPTALLGTRGRRGLGGQDRAGRNEGEMRRQGKGARERAEPVGCRGMGVGMPGGPRNERPKRECGTWAECTCQEGGGNAKVTGGSLEGEPGQEPGRGERDGQWSRGGGKSQGWRMRPQKRRPGFNVRRRREGAGQ